MSLQDKLDAFKANFETNVAPADVVAVMHRATADLFRQGLDIPRVALMTGHKTWAQLKRYTNIRPEDVHAAVAQRGNVVPMKKPRPARPAATRAAGDLL